MIRVAALCTLLVVTLAVAACMGVQAPPPASPAPGATPATKPKSSDTPQPMALPAPQPPAKPVAAPPPPMAAPARPGPKPLADFPWPPPEPSAHVTLEDALFQVKAKPAPTLGAVNNRLEKALNQSGYEYSYYRAGSGFALVARLERIHEDGTPQPEQFRFLQPGAREPFSLSGYIKQLFFAPSGFYRMIVFVATDQSIVTWGKAIDTQAATQLLRQGASGLTDDIEGLPWTRNHSVTVLIYEFQKSTRDSEPITLRPSRLPARTHLERARIHTALTSPP